MRTLAIVSLLVASPAYAGDLKPVQEEAKQKFEQGASRLVTNVNKACGTKYAKIESDFENYDKERFGDGASTICSFLTYSLGEVCKSEPYKKAVNAKIKGIACILGKAPPADGKMTELKGGVFTYHMDPKTANAQKLMQALKEFLDK